MAQPNRPVASAGLVVFIVIMEIARAPTPINHLPLESSYMQDPLQERHRRSHQPGRRLWGTPSPCGGTLTHGPAGDQWRTGTDRTAVVGCRRGSSGRKFGGRGRSIRRLDRGATQKLRPRSTSTSGSAFARRISSHEKWPHFPVFTNSIVFRLIG